MHDLCNHKIGFTYSSVWIAINNTILLRLLKHNWQQLLKHSVIWFRTVWAVHEKNNVFLLLLLLWSNVRKDVSFEMREEENNNQFWWTHLYNATDYNLRLLKVLSTPVLLYTKLLIKSHLHVRKLKGKKRTGHKNRSVINPANFITIQAHHEDGQRSVKNRNRIAKETHFELISFEWHTATCRHENT